jgi:UDPglucose--hexose-1-phosphate uridylyltransferase
LLLPKTHQSQFEEAPLDALYELAQVLKITLSRVSRALNRPPYNVVLHTAPAHDGPLDHYHWHLEIMPTLTRVAGFEWGSGFYINPTPPEEAAAYLREMDVGES